MVRKYIHRNTSKVVEAIRFGGEIKEVADFVGDHPVTWNNGTLTVAVDCENGCREHDLLSIGDFVVRTLDGKVYICSDRFFMKEYSEVEAKSDDDLKFNPLKKTYMPSALIEATYRIKSLSIKVDKVLIDHLVKMLEQGAKATERVEQLERRIVEERRESRELGHQNIVNLCTRILEGVDANGQKVCGE